MQLSFDINWWWPLQDEINSQFGFSKSSISHPYGRSVLGMELVRGPYEPNRRSLFLHQRGYVEKICQEYAQSRSGDSQLR